MVAQKRRLNPTQLGDLSDWIARNGENYERYIEWCNLQNLPQEARFSKGYLPTWIQRRRAMIQAKRAVFREEIRSASRLPKVRRMELLEASVERIQGRIVECQLNGDDFLLLKMEDQLRRQLESLAKEMGEFNAKPEDDDRADVGALGQRMVAALEAVEKTQPAIEPPVDAEWTTVTEPVIQHIPQEVG